MNPTPIIAQAGDHGNFHEPLATNQGLLPYLMHGSWESLWDHENSHLDPCFRQAATAIARYALGGPYEPFYHPIYTLSPHTRSYGTEEL